MEAGAKVTLDASGSSDPDGGDTLIYSWEQTAGPGVALSDAAAAGPTFTAPSGAAMLTFRVTVSDGGDGSDSDEVTITVEAPASTVPAAPANLTATPGNGQITLTWDAPQDESVRRYQVRLRQDGKSWGPRDRGWSIAKSTGITLSGLVNGTVYTAQVRAVNANGAGPAEAGPVTPSK